MPLRYWFIYSGLLLLAAGVALLAARSGVSLHFSGRGGVAINPLWTVPILAACSVCMLWRISAAIFVPLIMCFLLATRLLFDSLIGGLPSYALAQGAFVMVLGSAGGFGWWLRIYLHD